MGNDELRVGTPERERAVSLLNDAFASGYLDVAEFDERVRTVYTSRTRGELQPLVDDLPGGSMLFPDGLGDASESGVGAVAAPALTIDADWTTVRRKGSWEVPPRILVTGTLGTVELDLRHAAFVAPTTRIEIQASATTVKLRVGPDHTVRYDELAKSGWSDVKDKAGSPTAAGGPVIVVVGALTRAGSLQIRR